MWDLWWTKWHWGRFPPPALIPQNAPYSSVIWCWYSSRINGQHTKWAQLHLTPQYWKEMGWLMNWKLFEIKWSYNEVLCRGGDPLKASVSITIVLVRIRTVHLPNTSLHCYCYTKLPSDQGFPCDIWKPYGCEYEYYCLSGSSHVWGWIHQIYTVNRGIL
jgi:hypothetical protein